MCFIKKAIGFSQRLHNLQQNETNTTDEETKTYQIDTCQAFPYKLFVEPTTQICTSSFTLLPQLLSNLLMNSSTLAKLQQVSPSLIQNLNKADSILDEAFQEINQNTKEVIAEEHLTGESWRSKEKVIEKLFGAKEYKYRLKLKHRFPATIYKERNLALNVELVNSRGERVMNCKHFVIQPIQSTSALQPARSTASGSPKARKENSSSKARQKSISTMDRPPS